MMDEYAKEDHKPSADEGAIKKMIKQYKETVDSIRSPVGMKQSDVDDGYKIVDGLRDGTIDFEAGQSKIKAAMSAHSYPVDEEATDVLGIFEQYLSEGEFMVQHEETRKHLDAWARGEMSDQEVMLEIERVSPGMMVRPRLRRRLALPCPFAALLPRPCATPHGATSRLGLHRSTGRILIGTPPSPLSVH